MTTHSIVSGNPKENPDATAKPMNTLFVARLAYEVTETQLRNVFERFGPVSDVKIVKDKEGKPRGLVVFMLRLYLVPHLCGPHPRYAFIEFEDEEDMKGAYRKADGMKLEGRTILVDVERGRTVPNFKPRRLGGGIGDPRPTVAKKQKVK